ARPEVHDALRSPGAPLDDDARDFFEPRFGHDFGRVRVHADARSAESAAAVGARAYTVGRDVVFGAGAYAPETEAGHGLLAHELTHVVQQAAGPVADRLQAKPDGKGPAGGTKTFSFKIRIDGPLTADELTREFVRQYYG